jgi:hypothetical protein
MDDDFLDDADELRNGIIRRARGEGLAAAFDTALDLCQDKQAPPSARAAALSGLLKIAELDRDSDDDRKEPYELDGEALRRRVKKIERGLRARLASLEQGGASGDSKKDQEPVRAPSPFD